MSNIDREYEHSPSAKLDYGFDWKTEGWLAEGETIQLSEWNVDAGLTKSDETVVDGVAALFVTGGEIDKSYKLTNTVTTRIGATLNVRKDSRVIKLSCKNR